MSLEVGTRVKITEKTSYLKGKTGVVVDEGYSFGSGTTVILDGEEESVFFSYREMERI